jgi:rhodanese-related sulfurtransferase
MRLEVLETPGHTIESISILVFDLAKSADKPHAVLTGDTLFIGDVGRPDLRASIGWSAQELGGYLYESVHNKLMKLPDETLVYPAHGAGSLCGKNISSDTVSTLGQQKLFNYALQPMSKEEFIRLVSVDQPDAPAYFTYDALLNTRERSTLDDALKLALKPIELADLIAMDKAEVQILDVRDAADYAIGHMAGSINIGLSGQYATWAGTLLDAARPIVIIAEPGREEEAALRLGRIGFDRIDGYLRGGMAALADRPDLIRATERASVPMLIEELESPNPPVIIDVRSQQEWKEGHIPESRNIPLSQLKERFGEVPRDRRIAVHCAGGYRSSIAASLLHLNGASNLVELAGGITAWEAANHPIERG